jgi:hypothetical protein
MSDLVKRQHFVPRTYLKNFGFQNNEEYFIHVLPRLEKTVDKIFEANIKNVALKKNLYTLPGETVEQKMAIEKFYSHQLESKYDSVYKLLTDPTKKTISDEERELVIATVVTMFYRTTRWINMHNEFMNRVFDQAYQLCQQTGNEFFTYEKTKFSVKGKTLDELTKEYNSEKQPIMIMTQLEVALKLITLKIQNFDGIVVSKLGDDNSRFVTSDNPVVATNVRMNPIMPFDPSNILRLPLDEKHMLLIMPEGEKAAKNIIFRNQVNGTIGNMEKLTSNFQQMDMAERFMFGNKLALEGYLSTKEESEMSLTKEELERTNKRLEEILHKKVKTLEYLI